MRVLATLSPHTYFLALLGIPFREAEPPLGWASGGGTLELVLCEEGRFVEAVACGQQGQSCTWAPRSKASSLVSVQLLWMGPQAPSGPQVLFTTPVLFTGQGACAIWPALVTFQAMTAESSGQVVSPSEE